MSSASFYVFAICLPAVCWFIRITQLEILITRVSVSIEIMPPISRRACLPALWMQTGVTSGMLILYETTLDLDDRAVVRYLYGLLFFGFRIFINRGSSMPFYRYECDQCEHEFRILHLNGADGNISCPLCESVDIRRLLPRVSVQFKGSGYYKTDRANKKSTSGTKGLSEKDKSTESASKELKDSKVSTGKTGSDLRS